MNRNVSLQSIKYSQEVYKKLYFKPNYGILWLG